MEAVVLGRRPALDLEAAERLIAGTLVGPGDDVDGRHLILVGTVDRDVERPLVRRVLDQPTRR